MGGANRRAPPEARYERRRPAVRVGRDRLCRSPRLRAGTGVASGDPLASGAPARAKNRGPPHGYDFGPTFVCTPTPRKPRPGGSPVPRVTPPGLGPARPSRLSSRNALSALGPRRPGPRRRAGAGRPGPVLRPQQGPLRRLRLQGARDRALRPLPLRGHGDGGHRRRTDGRAVVRPALERAGPRVRRAEVDHLVRRRRRLPPDQHHQHRRGDAGRDRGGPPARRAADGRDLRRDRPRAGPRARPPVPVRHLAAVGPLRPVCADAAVRDRGDGRVLLGRPPGRAHGHVDARRPAPRRLPDHRRAPALARLQRVPVRPAVLGLRRRHLRRPGRRPDVPDGARHPARLGTRGRDRAGPRHALGALGDRAPRPARAAGGRPLGPGPAAHAGRAGRDRRRPRRPRRGPRRGRPAQAAALPRLPGLAPGPRRDAAAGARAPDGLGQHRAPALARRPLRGLPLGARPVRDRPVPGQRRDRRGREQAPVGRHRPPHRRAPVYRERRHLEPHWRPVRLRRVRRRRQRDRHLGREPPRRRPEALRRGDRRDQGPVVEPRRAPDRVRRRQGRHHRPLPRRRRRADRRPGPPAHQRPLRRPPAVVEPRRPDHRVLDRPRAPDRLRPAHVLAHAARALPRRHGRDRDARPLRRRQAHQPGLEPGRPEPLLHLRPRRVQRRLPLRRRGGPGLPGDEPGDGRLGHLGPLAGAVGGRGDRGAGVLGVRGPALLGLPHRRRRRPGHARRRPGRGRGRRRAPAGRRARPLHRPGLHLGRHRRPPRRPDVPHARLPAPALARVHQPAPDRRRLRPVLQLGLRALRRHLVPVRRPALGQPARRRRRRQRDAQGPRRPGPLPQPRRAADLRRARGPDLVPPGLRRVPPRAPRRRLRPVPVRLYALLLPDLHHPGLRAGVLPAQPEPARRDPARVPAPRLRPGVRRAHRPRRRRLRRPDRARERAGLRPRRDQPGRGQPRLRRRHVALGLHVPHPGHALPRGRRGDDGLAHLRLAHGRRPEVLFHTPARLPAPRPGHV